MKPNPFELFCMYYLGIGPDGQARFYNVHAIARHFWSSKEDVERWLSEWNMEPDRFPHTDFNLAQAHGKAQELALVGGGKDLQEFCRKTFEEFVRKSATSDRSQWFEDIDYDRIWGDEMAEDEQP